MIFRCFLPYCPTANNQRLVSMLSRFFLIYIYPESRYMWCDDNARRLFGVFSTMLGLVIDMLIYIHMYIHFILNPIVVKIATYAFFIVANFPFLQTTQYTVIFKIISICFFHYCCYLTYPISNFDNGTDTITDSWFQFLIIISNASSWLNKTLNLQCTCC